MEVLEFFLSASPGGAFVGLMILAAILTIADDIGELRFFLAVIWIIMGIGCLVTLTGRGVPVDVAAKYGAYMYFSIIVGSFFRPGLFLEIITFGPRCPGISYELVYSVSSWIVFIYYLAVYCGPLVDPYYSY